MKKGFLIIMAATYKYLPRWGNSFLERYFLLFSIDIFLLIIILAVLIQDIFDCHYTGFLKNSANPLVIIIRLIIGYLMIFIIDFFVKRFFYRNEIEIKRIIKTIDQKKSKRITLLFQLVIWIIFMTSIFLHSENLNPWK